MRLTTYTDYSLRVLMYVAMKDGLSTIQEIADAYNISKNHLMKVTLELGRHGLLETVRGRNGGLRLAGSPDKIGLGDVVRLMEEDFAMVECFTKGNGCIITAPCRLKGILSDALAAYLAVLDRYTLADLTKRNSNLARTLFAA
jgi:Rrf2 family nitric oxide-sensitive transcriptional repressor